MISRIRVSHRLLLSCAALFSLSASLLAEEPPPAQETPKSPPYDAAMARRWLESLAQPHGWPMTYKEDGDLVLAGTCDAKILEDGYKISRQAMDKATALLKTDAKDLQSESKIFLLYFSNKPEYMAYAQDKANATRNEGVIKLMDTVPAVDTVFCLDPSYQVSDPKRRHFTVHNLSHAMISNYAAHHGETPIPGWIFEGFASWLESSILACPGISCVGKVGYDDQYQKRLINDSWDRVVFQVVKDTQSSKTDPKTGRPVYTRLGNLMGVKFETLTPTDVAVSWALVTDLTKKPKEFKAFLDAVLAGTKQADAFKAAFKKSVDDYEKDWMKRLLDNPPETPKKK